MGLKAKLERKDWNGKAAVLQLEGQLDSGLGPDVEDQVNSALAEQYLAWAVDLSGLEYISSSGVAALVNLKGKLDRVTGSLCLFGASGRVDKVLSLMGNKRLFRVFENEDQAREALQGA